MREIKPKGEMYLTEKPMKFRPGDAVLFETQIADADEACRTYLIQAGGKKFWTREIKLHPLMEGKTYEDGLNDAWDAAKKITCTPENGGLSHDDYAEVFGTRSGGEVFAEFAPQEVIEKIKTFEDTAIHVGDVVTDCHGFYCVVIARNDNYNNHYRKVLYADGDVKQIAKGGLQKTGRTLDVAGFLKQIGDAE